MSVILSFWPVQEFAVMNAHLVTMEIPGRWVGSVNPVIATTTSMRWTQSRVMPEPANACTACTTARAPPARTASWVTTAMPCSRTAGVSALVSPGLLGSHLYTCDLTIEWPHWNTDQFLLDVGKMSITTCWVDKIFYVILILEIIEFKLWYPYYVDMLIESLKKLRQTCIKFQSSW